jgi:hypothetical protein
MFVIDPSSCGREPDALFPCLGCSSAGELERECPMIDRTNRMLALHQTSSFFQFCTLSPRLLEMLSFLPKTYKTKRTQKESKIAQTNKTSRLTNIN